MSAPALTALLAVSSLLTPATPGTPAVAAITCSIPSGDRIDETHLRSRSELDAWLRHCPSPLDHMTPGGRARFLGTLDFNERGVTRISVADLEQELTGAEINAVFALLGLPANAGSWGLDPTEAEQRRHAPDHGPGASDIELRYNALYYAASGAPFDSQREAGAFMADLYDALFPATGHAAAVAGASNHDLRLLYSAAVTSAKGAFRPDHVDAAATALAALEERGIATRGDLSAMLETLIHAGRLDEARDFATRHAAAGFEPLPAIVEPVPVNAGVPSVLRLAGDTLVHEAVARGPLQIIVVASYGCAFSRAAADDIPRDPVLGPLFREHALWLAAPHHLDNIPALARWNADNPDAALAIATSDARWPMLELGTVPQFHVLRDGKLIATVAGWPRETGNREALLEVLRGAGVPGIP